jgi:hypothetical protein
LQQKVLLWAFVNQVGKHVFVSEEELRLLFLTKPYLVGSCLERSEQECPKTLQLWFQEKEAMVLEAWE